MPAPVVAMVRTTGGIQLPCSAANDCMRSHFFFYAIGAIAIALVNHENIGNLHNASLETLYIVAHAWHQHHDGDVRQAYDVDFILSDTHSFDQQALLATGFDDHGNICGSTGEAAQRAAGGHASQVEAGIASCSRMRMRSPRMAPPV